MNKYSVLLIGSIVTLLSFSAFAGYGDRQARDYGERHVRGGWVCNPYKYVCHRVNYRPAYWHSRYENERYGWRKNPHKKKIVKNTEPKFAFEAPPEKIDDTNIVKVNLSHGTWAAYDTQGELVKSGKVSGGKGYCPDINKKCRTATGTFKVYEKRGASCKSKIFPVGKGGAPMPYCMFFHGGFAMHGSNAVPNYNASHGCVRMTPADAKWLNQNFVTVGSTRVNVTYDKMVPQEKKEVAQNEESTEAEKPTSSQ